MRRDEKSRTTEEIMYGKYSNWTPQQRDVGQMIVDMFEHRDPSETMKFYPRDICYHYGIVFNICVPNVEQYRSLLLVDCLF